MNAAPSARSAATIYKRDQAHASRAFNADTGAWTCHRCGSAGLLEECVDPGDGTPLIEGEA